MSNVINSTKTSAQTCVELTPELKAQNLALVYLFFRQWTGTTSMARTDYAVGANGSLPPSEVAASYGLKRVIDPKELRVFENLKRRAEALLENVGLPFCKGTVIPVAKSAEVISGLKGIAEEYNRERDRFVSELPTLCQQWIAKNPGFASRLVIPTQHDIAERINADFAIFQFTPLGNGLDATKSVNRTVDGLFGEVIADVVRRAKILRSKSVEGKQPEDLSQRTLSTLRVIEQKLRGLQFINTGVLPIVELVDRLLSWMPRRREGKFSVHQFQALHAGLGVLVDEDLLQQVASRQVTLDGYFATAFPTLHTQMVGSNSAQPSLLTPAPAADVSEPTSEAAPAAELSMTLSTAVAAPAPTSELRTPEVGPAAADISEANAEETSAETSVQADAACASAPEPELAPEPLAQASTEVKGEEDWSALLDECFAEPETKSPEKVDAETESESHGPEESIPPAPERIFMSAW